MSELFTTFSFNANSDKPDDLSGVATFFMPAVDGAPPRSFTTASMNSDEAWSLHHFIQHVYAVGEAYGYAACKDKVLSAL